MWRDTYAVTAWYNKSTLLGEKGGTRVSYNNSRNSPWFLSSYTRTAPKSLLISKRVQKPAFRKRLSLDWGACGQSVPGLNFALANPLPHSMWCPVGKFHAERCFSIK